MLLRKVMETKKKSHSEKRSLSFSDFSIDYFELRISKPENNLLFAYDQKKKTLREIFQPITLPTKFLEHRVKSSSSYFRAVRNVNSFLLFRIFRQCPPKASCSYRWYQCSSRSHDAHWHHIPRSATTSFFGSIPSAFLLVSLEMSPPSHGVSIAHNAKRIHHSYRPVLTSYWLIRVIFN